jgi:hypothetical protein
MRFPEPGTRSRKSDGKATCGRRSEAAGVSAVDRAVYLDLPVAYRTADTPCSAAAEIKVGCGSYGRKFYEAPLHGRCVGDDGIDLVR